MFVTFCVMNIYNKNTLVLNFLLKSFDYFNFFSLKTNFLLEKVGNTACGSLALALTNFSSCSCSCPLLLLRFCLSSLYCCLLACSAHFATGASFDM